MSAEQGKSITEIFKWVAYGSIAIASFLASNTYSNVISKMDKQYEKLEMIDSRLIRVEYELKLR